jgi:hypothetical protein
MAIKSDLMMVVTIPFLVTLKVKIQNLMLVVAEGLCLLMKADLKMITRELEEGKEIIGLGVKAISYYLNLVAKAVLCCLN